MDPPANTDPAPSNPETSPLSSPHPSQFEPSDDEIGHDTTQQPSDRRLPGLGSNQRKLQRVMNTLRQCGWSFKTFLRVWTGTQYQSSDIILQHQYYRNKQNRVDIFYDALEDLSDQGFSLERYTLGSTITDELSALIQKPYFNRFDHVKPIDDIDFSEAVQIMEETAPQWCLLLKQLLSNTRAHRASYPTTTSMDEALSKRLFTITCIIYHSRAKRQSNFLATTLAAYLMSSGTKRRVIETLAGLGICHGYQQTNRLMNDIAQESLVGASSSTIS